jgi:hypothetical protein
MGPAGAVGSSFSRAEPSEASVEALRQTKPWVQFLAVMAFLGSAFMLLGGVGSLLLGVMAAPRGDGPPMAALAAFYIPFAFLYVYPGYKLWQYAQSIGKLVASRSMEDLEIALGHQKSFWKFAGIVTIGMMVLYALFIVGVVMATAIGLSRVH